MVDARQPPKLLPYPESHIKYKIHGDTSLDVDRLHLLQAALTERFGQKLAGSKVRLETFYVVEMFARDSFVQDASGKSVPNEGPYQTMLIGQLAIYVDDHPFGGVSRLSLPEITSVTRTDLAKVTREVINNMLNEMAKRWGSSVRSN